MQRLAAYTTIYPGAVPYLAEWHSSVTVQTDRDFKLWIGLDGIDSTAVESAIGASLDAVWTPSKPNNTPAGIRQDCLARIVETFDAVVLVDSDDILHPTRIAAARAALKEYELAGCALRLVDRNGQDLGTALTIPQHISPESILPRNNAFGFSNSAYRSELLRRCLPVPSNVTLVDWFIASRAWLMGARIGFDTIVRMDYRQHGENTAPIRFPYDTDQVIRDTKRVIEHFHLLQATPTEGVLPDRWAQVQEAASEVQRFSERILAQPDKLKEYVRNLNALDRKVIWWWDVAQPALRSLWKDSTEVRI